MCGFPIIFQRTEGCGVSYEDMKACIYDPLPSINQSTMHKKEEKGFYGPKKAENDRFHRNLQSMGETG
jgi:hypothetical protein